MKASWIFVILLLVLVAIFSVQNADPIAVRFLGWQYSASAALVIQLAALLGGLVGLTVGSVSARAARRRRDDAEAERGRRAREEAATIQRFDETPTPPVGVTSPNRGNTDQA